MSPSPHLKTETSSFRNAAFSDFEFRMLDKVQNPSHSEDSILNIYFLLTVSASRDKFTANVSLYHWAQRINPVQAGFYFTKVQFQPGYDV
jgi:hypothetical protein